MLPCVLEERSERDLASEVTTFLDNKGQTEWTYSLTGPFQPEISPSSYVVYSSLHFAVVSTNFVPKTTQLKYIYIYIDLI
jgi:hypothetical protein